MRKRGKTEQRRRRIWAGLIMRGITAAQIARELEVTRGLVANVIAGRAVSRRVQAAVAKAIGKDYEEIWGAKTGERKKGSTT